MSVGVISMEVDSVVYINLEGVSCISANYGDWTKWNYSLIAGKKDERQIPSKVELQHWLVKFVAEVRQIDGIHDHPAHQICCCCGLGQPLHATGCTDVDQKF